MLDKSSMHRLIGAGIMLVVAVSILPILLDGERPEGLGKSVKSPSEAPEIAVIKIKPAQPLDTSSSSSTEANKVERVTNPARVSVEKVDIPKSEQQLQKDDGNQEKQAGSIKQSVSHKTASTNSPVRWAVQIASFKNRNNAIALVEKLQAENYAAYSITTKSLHKVFVGPEIRKSRSEAIKEEIKKAFKLEGFVVKYSGN